MGKINKIKDLRLEAELSQNQLARLANLDRATVSAAENYKPVNELSMAKLARALSKALNRAVDISELNFA